MKRSAKPLLLLFLFLVSTPSCGLLGRSEPKSGLELLLLVHDETAKRDQLIERSMAVIELRADAIGANVKLERKDTDKILLRIGELPDMRRVKNLLLSYDRIELRAVVSQSSPSPVQTYSSLDEAKGGARDGEEVLPYTERVYPEEKLFVIVKESVIVANEDIRHAQAVPGSGSDYEVTFSLKPAGAERFSEWTARNINNYLAVVMNKEVKTIAYIKGPISDAGSIQGSFTRAMAEDLALILRSGSLPVPVKVIDEKRF